MKENLERKKNIFQKRLEKETFQNIVLLVIIGCMFFSAAIFGVNYLNIQFNAEKHLDFLSQAFQDAYLSVEDYMDDLHNDTMFLRCIDGKSREGEVQYSVSKRNVTSPVKLNLILTDQDNAVVFSSFSSEDMNLHRLVFNHIISENAIFSGKDIYNTVYFFSGKTSEYVFSKPLYRDGILAGSANIYVEGSGWSGLFSDYQYDSIITSYGDDIIFCSKEGFLAEHNTNQFTTKPNNRIAYLHGIRYLVSSRKLEREQAIIYSFIYNPPNALYLAVGILTIVILGFFWLAMSFRMSQVMAQRNAHSVNMLAEEMRIIRHGDSDHVIELSTGDEFEEIGEQINRMVKSIYELNYRNTELIRLNSMIEISNLHTQINPHFIYNTLDTIKYLIMSEPDKAAYLIEKFTHLLRYSINNTKQDVLLSEDIGYIEDYLYIQKIRFGERFLCRIEIPEECRRYYVQKLLLQPLIENSIKYGFKKKMEIEVRINGWCEGDYLILTEEDNGMGVPRSTLETLRAMLKSEELRTEHNGLHNLARRIMLEYGDGSGLFIDSVEGEFFKVTVKLRYKGESHVSCCISRG